MADDNPNAEAEAEAKRKAADEEAKRKEAEEEAKIAAKAEALLKKQEADRLSAEADALAKRREERHARMNKLGKDAETVFKDRIRAVSDAVHRNVPYEARQHGACYVGDAHPLNEHEHDIPDGSFRITGRDWIVRFEDGRLAEIVRATPRSDPADYVEFA